MKLKRVNNMESDVGFTYYQDGDKIYFSSFIRRLIKNKEVFISYQNGNSDNLEIRFKE